MTITCPPYQIIEEIASGYCYKALDPANNRLVSIRVVRIGKGTKSNAGLLMNIQMWRDRMAGVNHPHVARLYEVKYGVAEVYLVTEWVEGHTLRSMMMAHTAIAHPLVIYYMGQIGQALDYIHEKGVIHRDVTLQRMIIDASGTAKLIDVGLAGMIPQINRIGGLDGAERGYSAPEELRNSSPSIEADLYRFSVACYELMGGVIPFTATTPHELREQILRGEISPITHGNKSTTKSLNKIFQSALSVTPANRPKSAGELLKSLSRSGGRFSSQGIVTDSQITTRNTTVHERPIRQRVRGIIALLLCVSLIAGYEVVSDLWAVKTVKNSAKDGDPVSPPPAPSASPTREQPAVVPAKVPAQQPLVAAPTITKAVLAEVASRTGHERTIVGGIRGLASCQWGADTMARQFVRTILHHDNPGVRREALRLVASCKVGELGSEAALLLKDDDAAVRRRALDAVAAVGDERLVTDLVITSLGERDPLINAKMLQVAEQLRGVAAGASSAKKK